MDIGGFNLDVGNDTVIWICLMAMLAFMGLGMYFTMSINSKYPAIFFRITEDGVVKHKTYRLKENRSVVVNDMMSLLVNKPKLVGTEDIVGYPSIQFAENTRIFGLFPSMKLKKLYIGRMEGGKIFKENATITKEEIKTGKEIGDFAIHEIESSRDLLEQQDPLKSEVIKVLPIAILFFIMGLIVLAALNGLNDTAKIVSQNNLAAAQIMEKVTDHIVNITNKTTFVKMPAGA